MAVFHYSAKQPTGKIIEADIEAFDQKGAIDKLRAQRLNVVSIQPKIAVLSSKDGQIKTKKIKSKDLVIFSRQLSTLVSAGVPLVQGLAILSDQIVDPNFKLIMSYIKTDIENGVTIADALKKHPKGFSELYVAMIRAGETGGVLDVILERLSGYLEAAEELRGKVKGAMVYPLVVGGVAGAVTLFLLVGVIPTFATVFESFGSELPTPTKILIGLSNILKQYILLILAAPVAGFFAFQRWYATPSGARTIDAQLLKVPVIGDMIRKVAVSKFTRTLGTLLKSGVPILHALETVSKTAGNTIIEDAIAKVRESIREGEKIAPPLRLSGVFPTMVVQMISVGEETGNLETMLNKIAEFYDHEVDTAIHAATSLIEPVIIVVMGLVIGAIVICMFLPIFEMSSLAH